MNDKTSINNNCPECGSPMVWETRTISIEYQGHKREYDSTGWWCTKCDEGILEGEELKKGFTIFDELRAKVDNINGSKK